jgi:RHS repeat-associated protein
VAFFANGNPIGTDTASPFTIDWANVPAGAYSLTAVASDNEGLRTTSAAVPITVGAGKALYFIHVDHLNTPRLIADATQKTVWRWDQQEPFGNNPASEDPDGDGIAFSFPQRFPGQYYEAETLLHYNYFRDYDASIGRYAESDPIGLRGGLNTYVYALGGPLSLSDPSGLLILVCVRALSNGLPGNHTYLWDTTASRCCGRVPGEHPLADCKEKGPGRTGDHCMPVEGSEGNERQIMGCCGVRGQAGDYWPYINDCVDTVNDCLNQSGLKMPEVPGGNRRGTACSSCWRENDTFQTESP